MLLAILFVTKYVSFPTWLAVLNETAHRPRKFLFQVAYDSGSHIMSIMDGSPSIMSTFLFETGYLFTTSWPEFCSTSCSQLSMAFQQSVLGVKPVLRFTLTFMTAILRIGLEPPIFEKLTPLLKTRHYSRTKPARRKACCQMSLRARRRWS